MAAQVFVVDRADFFAGAWPHGFVPMTATAADAFLGAARQRGRFEPRAEAEQRPEWKQWIPYCVLRQRRHPAGATEGLAAPAGELAAVYRVQRTSGQGEARLHGALSIGLGGHVEPEDDLAPGAPGAEFFGRALARELAEELVLATPLPAPRFVGLLNDDLTPVGRVHAGLVYVCDVIAATGTPPLDLPVREISKMRGGFGSLVELRELWQDPARFESWSQFLIHAGVAGPMGASQGTGGADRTAAR